MTQFPDRTLFQRIVDESIEVGYIRPPTNWRGHAFQHREMRPVGGNCFICCIPCFGRVDDELAVLIGTVFFVFSSFIAFAYTLRSTQSACQANRDLSEVRYMMQDPNYSQQHAYQLPPQANLYPHYQPAYNPHDYSQQDAHQLPPQANLYPHYQPAYNPHNYSQQDAYQLPPQANLYPPYQPADAPQVFQPSYRSLFRDAEILLEGRRSERTWVAISQGAMCVGAALLTAALLATFIIEGELVMLECGLAGVGLISAGAILYGGTRCFHSNYLQQAAAERISEALTY